MRKFLKILALILITILGILSILITAIFSGDKLKDAGLGGIAVIIVFLIYTLITSYAGSILAFSASFWKYPRKVIWFLAFSCLIYFLLILNNTIIFIGGGPQALILFAPIILYAISAFRFFRKLSKKKA